MQDLRKSDPFLAIATLLLFFVWTFFLKKIKRKLGRNKLQASCPLPPGNLCLPIVGETLHFMRCYRANNVGGFVEARKRKHGQVFRTSLFMEPTIVLDGPEANRFLYSNEGRLVRECYPSNSPGKLFGEKNIVTQFGAPHKHLRKLLFTGLNTNSLRKSVPRLESLTKNHFAQFLPANSQIVTLYSLLKDHTLSSTTNLLLGIEEEVNQAEMRRLFHLFTRGLGALPIYLPWTPYYKAFAAKAGMEKMVSKIIHERQIELAEESELDESFKDILSSFITAKDENGNPFTEQEIVATVVVLLSGAVDTTSNVLAFTIKFMLENPSCYEKVLKEQMVIAEAKVQRGEEALTWEDLQKMKYTWAVIQETMRLLPQVTVSFKLVMEDFEYGGYKVPCGWKIFHNIAQCCKDEKYFPNPKAFDPSRFVVGKTPTPYTYLPFGAGPHMCPGIDFGRMVILVFIHHLVRMFKMTLVDPTEPIRVAHLPFPANGLPMRIERIS